MSLPILLDAYIALAPVGGIWRRPKVSHSHRALSFLKRQERPDPGSAVDLDTDASSTLPPLSFYCGHRSDSPPELPERYHCPLVYTPGYGVPRWPTSPDPAENCDGLRRHTFPMDKFAAIARHLATRYVDGVRSDARPLVRSRDDFYRPLPFGSVPIERWIGELHCGPSYLRPFLSGALSETQVRTIGFREMVSGCEMQIEGEDFKFRSVSPRRQRV
mmetsp:Transcript_34409/g.79551  ORF Transcript_34409/g.79551 Transcript_34409/m.79551 type:complete len:217 (+) Transcript_34409:165-815(+)